MAESVSLLVTGDLHLGRHPTRIPEDLDGPEFSPRAIWDATVQEAVSRDVDAVVVTGDVLDQENQFFGAYGPFESGAQELDGSGIPLVLVAGNHDVNGIPRLVEELNLPGVHLLGAGGVWERWTLEPDNGPDIHFDGWSFPSVHVGESPLEGYDLEDDPNGLTVGVIHGDLDASSSIYAPLSTDRLVDTPPVAWLLGHIHKPGVRRNSGPFVLYPGSPQPLSPVERGPHGPWLVKLAPNGEVDCEQLPLATLRYDGLQVDVSSANDLEGLPGLLTGEIREHMREDVDLTHLELCLLRLKVVGRSRAHADLERKHETVVEQLDFREEGVAVRVETVEVRTRPPIDLEDLARGQDSPTAWLADFLLTLEDGDEDLDERRKRLISEALSRLREAHRASAYRDLRRYVEPQEPDRDEAVETLRRQAWLLLDTLVRQKEESEDV